MLSSKNWGLVMLITPELIATLPPLPDGWSYSYNSDAVAPYYVWIDNHDTHVMCLDQDKLGLWRVECGLGSRRWNTPFTGFEGFPTIEDAANAAAIFLTLRGEEYPWPNE